MINNQKLFVPYIKPIWRFPETGGTLKSSILILDWDFPLQTIHLGVPP